MNGEDSPPGGSVEALLRWVPALLAAAGVALVGARAGGVGLPVALAGAVALLAACARLSTPAAFAVGQVALVAALGGERSGAAVLAAEAALFGLLVAPDLSTARGRRAAGATVGAAGLLSAVAWGARTTWAWRPAAALALATTGTLFAYGLHRYEQVQLGVVQRE